MIIGEIRRYLRDNNMIRVARSVRDIAYKALTAKEKLSNLYSRDVSIREITEEVNAMLKTEAENKSREQGIEITPQILTVKNISDALDAVVEPISLFEPVYNDNGDSLFLMDQLCDNKNSDSIWTENIAVNDAIKKLTEREAQIISMRYYSGKTQMEVAKEVGISQAQVSRLEKSALNTIKKNI